MSDVIIVVPSDDTPTPVIVPVPVSGDPIPVIVPPSGTVGLTGVTGPTGPVGPPGNGAVPLSWQRKGAVPLIPNGDTPHYFDHVGEITLARASVNNAPQGSSIIVDINKNGVSIFTDQANRPTILPGELTSGPVTSMDVTSIAPGDRLTVDVDAVGSAYAGSGLIVTVWFEVTG